MAADRIDRAAVEVVDGDEARLWRIDGRGDRRTDLILASGNVPETHFVDPAVVGELIRHVAEDAKLRGRRRHR